MRRSAKDLPHIDYVTILENYALHAICKYLCVKKKQF